MSLRRRSTPLKDACVSIANMVEPTCLSDTVILLGIASTQYSENMYFASGAIVSSFIFFLFAWFWCSILWDFLSIHFHGGYCIFTID